MAAQGRYRDALALIKKENPFPAVCGRICNRRCEDACTRGTVDQAVAIDAVKKFIAEQDLNAAHALRARRWSSPSSRRAAVAAEDRHHRRRPRGSVLRLLIWPSRATSPPCLRRTQRPGGMLVYGIPSFKLEKDVIDAEIDVLRELGVEIRCGVEVGKDVTHGRAARAGL